MAYALHNVHETPANGDCGSRKAAEGTDIETSIDAANDPRPLPLRRLVLAAVFALSAAQYLYADVHLSIYRLPSLVVFASPR
jgi:hypothetical protein